MGGWLEAGWRLRPVQYTFPNGKCCPIGQHYSNSLKFNSDLLPDRATFPIWETKIEQNFLMVSLGTFLC